MVHTKISGRSGEKLSDLLNLHSGSENFFGQKNLLGKNKADIFMCLCRSYKSCYANRYTGRKIIAHRKTA